MAMVATAIRSEEIEDQNVKRLARYIRNEIAGMLK